ncbi:TIM44-like domain-containing protein [Ferrovibrio terrae]|uniref:Tim44 domain-containing protein n=1 Tax=Ferrovibrio terrae TaxID=2594003 RepID=UPI003137CE62
MIRKRTSLLVAILAASIALAPAIAAAKAGRGGSMGSRGSQTYQSAPATPTAPSAAPVQRSATPPATTQPAPAQTARPATAAAPAAQPAGFFQRPFMAGLMGGVIGMGIGGLLFGGGLFGEGGLGGLGFGGVMGMLLQFALIGGAIWLGLRLFRSLRGQQPQTAAAGIPGGYTRDSYNSPVTDIPPAHGTTQARVADMTPSSGGFGRTAGLQIGESDFEAFQQTLGDVQTAWSKGDLEALRLQATPEMVGYFGRELALLASTGLTNHVADVNLEQGDLAEAWSEDGIDYATVAMRWSALDYTTRPDGTVVEGSKTERGMSTEIWTFLRASNTPGSKWLLSAIQQPEL